MEVMLPEDIRDYIATLSGNKITFAIQFVMDNPDCGLETLKQAVIDGND
jgi:hypothetical protein